MKTTVFILLILLISGCVTQKKCSQRFPPQILTKDSIVYSSDTIKIKTVDTVYIKLSRDTIFDTKYVYIDRKTGLSYTDTSRLQNDFCISIAGVMYGELFHELITKDSLIMFTYDQYHTMVTTLQERYKTETQIIKENYVTGWQWFQIWAGRIVLILIVLFAAYKGFTTKFAGISRILK